MYFTVCPLPASWVRASLHALAFMHSHAHFTLDSHTFPGRARGTYTAVECSRRYDRWYYILIIVRIRFVTCWIAASSASFRFTGVQQLYPLTKSYTAATAVWTTALHGPTAVVFHATPQRSLMITAVTYVLYSSRVLATPEYHRCTHTVGHTLGA